MAGPIWYIWMGLVLRAAGRRIRAPKAIEPLPPGDEHEIFDQVDR